MALMLRHVRPRLLELEVRVVPATVSVNAASTVRTVPPLLGGVNIAWWDYALPDAQTQQMVEAAGLQLFRYPGGSSSDTFHFNQPPPWNGYQTPGLFGEDIQAMGGAGMITIDYGEGSPQEGAAFLAYLTGSPSSTVVIGSGPEYITNSWVTVNWGTVGYWASLRAASQLPTDDGYNFLRINHPAAFNVPYVEVGNEEYGGSWETDEHTIPHDPATYVAFAQQFAQIADQFDPSVSIGMDAGGTAGNYGSVGGVWIAEVLHFCALDGYTPGYISDHNYMYDPGNENDSTLLTDTATNPAAIGYGGPIDFAGRAAAYRELITQYLPTTGASVKLMCTEMNSVSYNPGKQTTSLVNGLWLADALGGILQTEYDSAVVWDLGNGFDTEYNNSSSLYGWRQGGDYGLLGDPGTNNPPVTAGDIPYPDYFSEEMFNLFADAGDTVISASSSDPLLAVYSVKKVDGHLDLLIINKNSAGSETGTFQVSGFTPTSSATGWQYGEAQDTAQEKSTTGASALAVDNPSLSVSGNLFSLSFPAYSMTMLDIAPGPSVATAASGTPNPVTGTTTVLSVLGADAAGESTLKYTWTLIGTPPAAVAYSANGTNAAKITTATFTTPGVYNFQVAISDASGNTVTSGVSITVSSTLTTVTLSPSSPKIALGKTQQFTATAYNQFGQALSPQPTGYTWSVVAGGVGSISSSGLYQAPSTSGGVATIHAVSGGVTGNATVTVIPVPTVSLTSSSNPIFAQPDTLNATLSAVAPFGNPTGTVTFLVGTATLGTATLIGGAATFPTSSLALGNNALTASYSGDSNYAAAVSTTLTQVVAPWVTSSAAGNSATTSLTSLTITFSNVMDAAVAGAFSLLRGTDGATPGTITVSTQVTGGVTVAKLTFSGANTTNGALNGGVWTLTVHHALATSAGVAMWTDFIAMEGATQVSTTTLTISPNPPIGNHTTTFTALVTGTSPSGTVTFLDGTTVEGTASVQAGKATLTTGTLALGSHSLTASYAGDSQNLQSTSAPVVINYLPVVSSVVVNGGQQQRSRVTSLTVTFNTVVNTALLASAFSLTRAGLPNDVAGDGATIGTINVAASTVGGQTVATLTFIGSNTEGGSLADGNWTLLINASDVVGGTVHMASNFSYTGIKRLFGDYLGSGTCDTPDLAYIATTFGLTSTNASFIAAFDSDGNGVIDSADLLAFGTRFGLSI